MLGNWLGMWPDSLQARLPWGDWAADPGGVSGWELDQVMDDLCRTYVNALEWCGGAEPPTACGSRSTICGNRHEPP